MKLILGGPSYRMEVDARHAAQLVAFALRACMPRVKRRIGGGTKREPSDIEILGTAYEHGTPVAYARNHLFTGALAVEDATHLLWLDSDCAFAPDAVGLVLGALRAWRDHAPGQPWSPLLGVPAPQRDGALNVWSARGVKMTTLRLDGGLYPCWAVGFGCVVFDLRWYRRCWPVGPWFRDSWDDGGIGYVSEDVGHCRALADVHDLAPVIAGAYVDHHARGAGSPPPVGAPVQAVTE